MSYPVKAFHAGDRVRFRQWDDMASEFRLDSMDDIDLGQCYFTKCMRHLCGTEATILGVVNSRIYLEDFEEPPDRSWVYSSEMLEPISSCAKFDCAAFVSMLGGEPV